MNKRLTDEELACVRTLVPAECLGLLHAVDSTTAELRARRAADLKPEEVEALKWTMDDLRADLNTSRYTEQWKKEAWAALAALARLVESKP